MLRPADLAVRPDFNAGPLRVSPGRREVAGPAGTVHVEPIVMQLLLALLDGHGRVVTRDELFAACWGSGIAGDDSLNRAIARARRATAEAAPGLLEIETIPRTGYRLTGEIIPETGYVAPSMSRRVLVGGGAALAAFLGGIGLWWVNQLRTDSRFEALMARADGTFRDGSFGEPQMIELLEQAVRVEPGSARAWGLLAYCKSRQVDQGSAEEPARTLREAEEAVQRALAIDAQEANALTALVLVRGTMLDWAARDRHLRNIVAIDGNNIPAMSELMALLQAAGLNRESWSWNQRILQLVPLSRVHLIMRALKLWILGDLSSSDKAIDQVRALWPLDPFGFGIRVMLFALTGRPRAALVMIDDAPKTILPPANASLWRTAAEALDTQNPKAIETARSACLDVARKTPWNANLAAMILGSLDETEAAFEVTEGYLLGRGKVVSGSQSDPKAVNDWNRRMTPWLFTPPLAGMRGDPRFLKLCKATGLVAYWQKRRVRPDYLVYRS